MKYGFIKLKGQPDVSVDVYMEVRSFERYKHKKIFRDNAISLCVYDMIYIGVFPLMFKESDIFKYNDEARLLYELPLSDVCFQTSSISYIADGLGCNNTANYSLVSC